MTAVAAQITQSLDGGHVDELVLTIAPVILRGGSSRGGRCTCGTGVLR